MHHHHTKHLLFHSAPPPPHQYLCETTLIFIFLVKDNFSILKVYGGARRSHGGTGRISSLSSFKLSKIILYSKFKNPTYNSKVKILF